MSVERIRVELRPLQADEVARAVEHLLEQRGPASDPWWATGLDEALRSGDGAALEDAWGASRIVEP